MCRVNIVHDAVIEATNIVVLVYFREDTEKNTLNSAKEEPEISTLSLRTAELS
jgi:hypothetical protein